MKHDKYYTILGVSQDCSADEIQRAFRTCARRYHPDVCRDPDAEERFKEINEAYRVLSDPQHRKLYDRYGENWEQAQAFEEAQEGFSGRSRDSSHDWGGRSEFFYQGGAETEDINEILRNLFSGEVHGDHPGRTIRADLHLTLNDLLYKRTQKISIAAGAGSEYSQRADTRTIDVKIPDGVSEGSVIRLKGQGEAGIGGGPPGDLLLTIKIAPDNRFRVDGFDLESEVAIAPWEAALGAKIDVATPEGRARLTIPAGTGSNRRFRMKGKGLAKKSGNGDLYVRVRVDVPKTLSAEEKELFEKLSRVSDYDPRQQYTDAEMGYAA